MRYVANFCMLLKKKKNGMSSLCNSLENWQPGSQDQLLHDSFKLTFSILEPTLSLFTSEALEDD